MMRFNVKYLLLLTSIIGCFLKAIDESGAISIHHVNAILQEEHFQKVAKPSVFLPGEKDFSRNEETYAKQIIKLTLCVIKHDLEIIHLENRAEMAIRTHNPPRYNMLDNNSYNLLARLNNI